MDTPIVIVGAGLSGLVAARTLLDEGHRTLVVDKARSVGGRLATRQIGPATLDHGAQFFTVRSDEFRHHVDSWIDAGIVESWCEGFDQIDGYPRYRVNGGMSQLARHLAIGLDVVARVRAQSIIFDGEGWVVSYDGGSRVPDQASGLISTAPVPETLAVLASGGVGLGQHRDGLEALRYHRVIALLVTTAASPDLGHAGALQQPDHPTFSFVADNAQKGISATPALTFHTSHELSAELWDLDDAAIQARLVPEAATVAGVSPDDFGDVQIKKWRYSGPVVPWPERCLMLREDPAPLVMAGDAFGGPKVEGAFLSGRAAGIAVADLLS